MEPFKVCDFQGGASLTGSPPLSFVSHFPSKSNREFANCAKWILLTCKPTPATHTLQRNPRFFLEPIAQKNVGYANNHTTARTRLNARCMVFHVLPALLAEHGFNVDQVGVCVGVSHVIHCFA
jgi:hypothetical protein